MHALAECRQMDRIVGGSQSGPAPPDGRRILRQRPPRRRVDFNRANRAPAPRRPDHAKALWGALALSLPICTEWGNRSIGLACRLDCRGQSIVSPGDHHIASAPEHE